LIFSIHGRNKGAVLSFFLLGVKEKRKMVNNVTATALDKLVNETKDMNSSKSDEKRKAKLEKKLENLINERADINPADAEALRNEAAALGRMADYTNHLADLMEKNKKQVEKKKLEEVKQLLMEKLGVPAEFVEQLSILVKAGPEALREASGVYRQEANKKRDMAAMMTSELHRIDNEIKSIAHVKDSLKTKKGAKNETMTDFLNRKLYEDSIRDNAELELKQALQLIEGGNGGNLANHV
jgi:uncharacterized tellurite resistance protein B-like protein